MRCAFRVHGKSRRLRRRRRGRYPLRRHRRRSRSRCQARAGGRALEPHCAAGAAVGRPRDRAIRAVRRRGEKATVCSPAPPARAVAGFGEKCGTVRGSRKREKADATRRCPARTETGGSEGTVNQNVRNSNAFATPTADCKLSFAPCSGLAAAAGRSEAALLCFFARPPDPAPPAA